jgi:hypothetical protein
MNNVDLLAEYVMGSLSMPQLLDKLVAANPLLQDVGFIKDEYEDSMVELDIKTAFELARALGVDLDELVESNLSDVGGPWTPNS